ncbi:MAG: alpha/beta hydrolase [Fidelibacterota bacterium]|nr:MAG: alpha/beta hydrolase [Candidatus Neomarinimicrobiota bacterium]
MKGFDAFGILPVGLLLILGCAASKQKSTPASLYKSPEAKAIAYESYDKVMEFWPVAYEEVWVETDYGTSHVIVSGPEGADPVFLLPGLFADATMWYANVGALAEHYRVYCLDQITYGGKSEPEGNTVEDIHDYVTWFSQHLAHFGYDKAAVAGLSYGSWLGLALAREIPDAIAAVIMLDPSETFVKMGGAIAWKGFWNFAFFPNRNKYRNFFTWIGGGFSSPQSDIWLEHMLDVIEHGSVGMFDIPQHRIYYSEDLTNVTMPVLVLAGGKPIVYKDPQVFAAAAAQALPHAEIEIVPGTGHSLNVEKADAVNARMVDFLSRNYVQH